MKLNIGPEVLKSIEQQADYSISQIDRIGNDSYSKQLIVEYIDMLKRDNIDIQKITRSNIINYHHYGDLVALTIQNSKIQYNHPFLKYVLSLKIDDTFPNRFWWYLYACCCRDRAPQDQLTFMELLISSGYNEEYILKKFLDWWGSGLIVDTRSKQVTISGFGLYFKDKIKAKTSFLGLKRTKGYGDLILQEIQKNQYYRIESFECIIKYYLELNISLDSQFILKGMINKNYSQFTLHYPVIEYLLSKDAETYSTLLLNEIPKQGNRPAEKYKLFLLINKYSKKDYSDKLIELGKKYFAEICQDSSKYFYEDRTYDLVWKNTTFVSNNFIEAYNKKNIQETYEFIKTVYSDATRILGYNIELIEKLYRQDCRNLLVSILDKKRNGCNDQFYNTLFDTLDKVSIMDHEEEVIQFCIDIAGKKQRVRACESLAKIGESIKDRAIELLHGKVVAERITGALILKHFADDPKIVDTLDTAINKERNDETRNIMLEAVKEFKFAKTYDLEQVHEMINIADSRKKLSKWSEKFLLEEDLPAMKWTDGNLMSEAAIRFLFYRMKQTKGIQSDIEAKQVILHIDDKSAEKMADKLLVAFVDSNANNKIKYYLTLIGLMGGDSVLRKLESQFRKSITDKRIKMAENVLGAIAMIGSNKALRVLEVISRKYANKKPKLSATATESLDLAAQELNISKDELADRIIPNFDFDGLYKEFEVEDETYRAYINNEFKLVYYNEDNKMRKSIPKQASAEIKKEFREIAKEVRAVSKTQTDRLERYMVGERKWKGEDWKEFFFFNPIMNVYAQQLLWLKIDGDNTTAFYCDEDGDYYDIEMEEVVINEQDEVCILHPLHLSTEQYEAWKEKLYDESMITIIPIMDRPIYRKLPEELQQSKSTRFKNTNIPKGADFVAPQLVKRGWIKSPSDGGSLEFVKIHPSQKFKAYPYIYGPAVYYQEGKVEASIEQLNFIRERWNEKVTIEDIPDIFYSETVADLMHLVNAE